MLFGCRQDANVNPSVKEETRGIDMDQTTTEKCS